ncbi:MAG: gluconate 2-dehydrogenase subunit 3 family protein [Gemmatimonadales bacterium]|nr:MAG: gluconate 2-dehydrogenase subunit 3 family protein [Gemmatimonadales bacterium]
MDRSLAPDVSVASSAPPPSRREFLTRSMRLAGGGWLSLHLPLLASLSACAREDALNGEPLRFFNADEGRTLEALVTRLIPSVDGIGAREAGAVHFIDRGLADFFAADAPFFRAGLAELMEIGFADLPEAEQIRHLQGIEEKPFFGFARALTIFGTFSDPRHGGGRGDAIHRIYGMDPGPGFMPPFGWYDAQQIAAASSGEVR